MTKTGKVYLVGAGPGDPGLLTVKGWHCLQQADLVLYDGLANPLLLRHSPAHAERTSRRRLTQAEISDRLIEAAREGKTVVRLKGGDPFIFGRGGEEAAALAGAEIPFEVVPGITAATAAAVYAGIALTHRDMASTVAFVTGHEDPTKQEPAVDYAMLARFRGTLVFYMGLHRLEFIVQSLITAGKAPQTPACVISRATTSDQRTVAAPLRELPSAVRGAELRPPSLIVVGDCVRQRDDLNWFEKQPLFGKRIGITRPAEQADSAVRRALALGAQPILVPTIQIRPPEDWSEVDGVLERLPEFDWLIFTSANGVRGLLNRLWRTGGDWRQLARVKLAAIGPSTAGTLAEFHLRADLVPETYRAEALAHALTPHVSGKRVLWARSSRGRDVLPVELDRAGADLEQVIVYRNVDVETLPTAERELLERGQVDWIGLGSPSIARSLKNLLAPAAVEQLGTRVKLAAISPVTAAAAREVGLPIATEAATYTWDGIFEAIITAECG